jgi:hypothetical protein
MSCCEDDVLITPQGGNVVAVSHETSVVLPQARTGVALPSAEIPGVLVPRIEKVVGSGGSGGGGGGGGTGTGGHTILDLDGVSYPPRTRLQFTDGFTVTDHEPTDLTAVELRLGLGLTIVDHSLTIDNTYFDLGITVDVSDDPFTSTDGTRFLMAGGDSFTSGTGSITDPQPANTFLAGPTSGSDALPVFRAIVKDDLPPLYEHEQMAAVNTLVLVHNLDCFPSVVLRDTVGNSAVPDVVYDSRNQLTITTTSLWSGVATLGR